MKKAIFFIIFLIPGVAFSEVNPGDEITSKKFNESTAHIGEVKTSVLTEAQFQGLYGTCWVQMIGQDISGSDLATLTGISNLPDARGRFLRTTGGNSPALMQTQEDQNKEHSHDISYVKVNNTNGVLGVNGNGTGWGVIPWGGNSGTIVSNPTNRFNGSDALGAVHSSGGDEARPKNLGVNRFIKIDKDCLSFLQNNLTI